MVFYGRLEDQANNPVAYAEISATTLFHNGLAKATGRFSTESDANGFFKLDGGRGESLELMPQERGYALASTNNIAFYGQSKPEKDRHHPDPNNPVIIKMWKLQGAEPLTTFNDHYKVSFGDSIHFDFVKQTVVPDGGDIKITINRQPGLVSSDNHPEWSVELETTKEGGVIEVTPATWATTYWAPVEGYQPRFRLVMSDKLPNTWSDNVDASFFVQTRNGGVYTKLSLKVGLNLNPDDPVDVTLYGVANTNGSCNWEGDPNTLKHD